MGENEKIKILLVDDNPANLVALAAILERPDYELVKANSGKEALSSLLHEDFAVVLLDVRMPEIDGFEVAKAMKSREKTKNTPIIFVTAEARELKDIYQGYAVGGVDYIQKPMDPDVVRAKVSVFAELFRAKREAKKREEIIRTSEKAHSLERERAERFRAESAEQRYYDLINWVDHAVLWEYDPINKRFRFVSKRSQQILGFSDEEWLNDPKFFFNHIPEADRILVQNLFDDASSKGIDGRCDHRFMKADGDLIWTHTGINPRKDVQGKVTLLWGLTLDITPSKTSEENQRFLAMATGILGSSLDYSQTLQKLTNLVVPALADWCIIDLKPLNGEPTRFVGAHNMPEMKESARVLAEKFPARPDKETPIQKVLKTGESVLMREVPDSFLTSVAQNEEHLKILRAFKIESLMIVPLKIRDVITGALTLASGNKNHRFTQQELAFAKDLALHAALAVENSRLYSEAKVAIKARDDVLSIVSHDFRNPLAAMRMSAQTILKYPQASPSDKIKQIVRSIDRMDRLISDLMDLSKVEAGKLVLDKRPQVAQALTKEIVEFESPLAAAKSITIVENKPETPIEFSCDHDRTLQVLANILGNAIKFTPEKGTITVGTKRMNGEALFWVSDTGPGIEKEEVPKVFERNWQSPRGKKHDGAGLGLYIAKKMVDAQHGRIWAESIPGKGSTFSFTLPL